MQKYDLYQWPTTVVQGRLQQTIKALTSKLIWYKHNRSFRQNNFLFSRNQHWFYQQLIKSNTDLPPCEETLQFWINITTEMLLDWNCSIAFLFSLRESLLMILIRFWSRCWIGKAQVLTISMDSGSRSRHHFMAGSITILIKCLWVVILWTPA